MAYLMALDQGTSSSRCMIFHADGRVAGSGQQALPASYPQPGWVEQDPWAIWETQWTAIQQAMAQSGLKAQDIRVVGITNQRETSLIWRRDNGQPIHPAIVWQDRRSEPECVRLREAGASETVQAKTGLRIDPYFSATKIQWMLRHVPGARAMAERGELAFGTVDTWLIWQLSRGAVHATDVSNASRTMLWNLHTQQWDEGLLALFDIPASLLPRVQPSVGDFGQVHESWFGQAIPIGGVAGDQQSALFGQACFKAGDVKNTYGTGCFALMHTGSVCQPSQHGLISTVAAQPGQPTLYALEGSVFIGGAVVQWLRDGLRAFDQSADVQALAESVPDTEGVMLVPAFTGLGAPYWQADARGSILGLTRGTTLAHIARAALESIAYQSTALLQAMAQDTGQVGHALRVDGGACANDLLMQMQADLLGFPVQRPAIIETTALGAAYLAGLQAGIFQSTDELSHLWRLSRSFEPCMSRDQAESKMAAWARAVRQTLAT